jgi:tetratricopeptide (TPR) repeat protein
MGSINEAGGIIRINSQLINSKTEEPLKSFQIDGSPDKILNIVDSLSGLISNSLIISRLEEDRPDAVPKKNIIPTKSPEAYRYFILGKNAFYRNDFPEAIENFLQALTIDSSLVAAMSDISLAYYNDVKYEQARDWCLRSHKKYDLMAINEKISSNAMYAIYFGSLNDRIRYLKQLIDIDDQNPMTYFNIGDSYFEMFEYDKAIPEFEKALDLFHKWGIKPYWGAFYYEPGISYHKTGQFKKEKKLYRKADKDLPDDPGLLDQHAWLALNLGDTIEANRYIEKWISIRKEELWSEARIAGYLAYVYSMADMPEKEEEYHRRALSLEPENTARMNYLTYFLIGNTLTITLGK